MLTQSDIAQRRQELRLVADRQFADDAKAIMQLASGQRLLARFIYDELRKPALGLTSEATLVQAAKFDLVKQWEAELQSIAPDSFRQMHDERVKAENLELATLRALTVPKSGER